MTTSTFRYRAARADGAMELGTVEAESRASALSLISGRGLFPVDVAEASPVRAARRALGAADLALGLRVLGDLLEAGLPVARALQAMDDLAPPAWGTGLEPVRRAVSEGASLARALREAPLGIPPLVIGIVEAGEASGAVAAAVRQAAQLMEERAATRAAILGALAYPLVLAGAGLASVSLLVGVVLPRFAAILADLGQSLPPTTRIVIGAAGVLRVAALPLLATGAIAAVGLHAWIATEAGERQWHETLLRVPVLGRVRRSAGTASSCGAISTLLASGVPVAAALAHGARASGDAALGARVIAARARVVAGSRIADALDTEQAATPTTVRLVRAGEQTGHLAAMLAHAATLERERAERLVKSAVRLLEPALIVSFGGVVALVAAALLQAIYSVRPGA